MYLYSKVFRHIQFFAAGKVRPVALFWYVIPLTCP